MGVKEGVLKGTDEYLVLVKNEDYEKLWLPDIFIDQAIDIRCCVCICIAFDLIQFNLLHQEPPLPHRPLQCQDLRRRHGQLCTEDEL